MEETTSENESDFYDDDDDAANAMIMYNAVNNGSEQEDLNLSCDSSDFDDDEIQQNERINPYQFEPYASHSDEDDRSSDHDDRQMQTRLMDLEWCLCNQCEIMPTVMECICCQEISRITDVTQDIDDCNCITNHPGFEPVCQNVYVLQTAYYQYKQQYGVELEDTPQRYRYTAYRQLARWVWGFLGKEVRVVLPACAVKHIRSTFPDPAESYTGFSLAH